MSVSLHNNFILYLKKKLISPSTKQALDNWFTIYIWLHQSVTNFPWSYYQYITSRICNIIIWFFSMWPLLRCCFFQMTDTSIPKLYQTFNLTWRAIMLGQYCFLSPSRTIRCWISSNAAVSSILSNNRKREQGKKWLNVFSLNEDLI